MPRTRQVPQDAPPVPVVEDVRKLDVAKTELETASKQMKRRLAKEPMVKVNGNPMFAAFIGKEYTYLFNDIPVTIRFDGRDYFYPKSIAENLSQKLKDIAVANTPVDLSERI